MAVNRDNVEVKIRTEWCKGCGICVAFCPKNVLGLSQQMKVQMVKADECIKCGQCELRCPDYAIYLGGIGDE